MKKKFLLVVVLFLVCISQIWAWGIGVEAGLPLIDDGGLPGNNVMLSLKLDNAPLLGIGIGGIGSNISIGLIADFWLIQEPFAGIMGVYLGPGAYLGLVTGTPAQVSIGGRLPIGLQIFPVKWLELFVEIAPALGMNISNAVSFGWNLQAAAGLRFWFN